MEKKEFKKATSEIREYVRTRIIYLKEKNHSVKEFQEVTFPKIVKKAKKENGIIFFGDETGICNQENYQRGFSPAGVAPVVKLPVKKEKINMISAISRQGHCEFMCYSDTFTQ